MSALSGLDSTDPSSADTTEATEPVTMPKGHEIKDNGAKKDIKKTRFYTYFQKNSKRDSYTMTATCSSNMQGASVNMPLTMVKSGKKAYMSMKAPLGNGVAMTMSFISDGQKFYMVFPEARMYLALDASEAGDVNEAMGSLSAIDFEGMEYVKTSEVKADGKKYICEEYKSNDSTIKCYFYGDELVKMEILSSEGVLVCDDIKFSSKVQGACGLHRHICRLRHGRRISGACKMSVTNKNVIITGAAGGIGRAAALAFAKNGFGVLINYRTAKDAAEKLCEEINSQGGRAVRFKADVSVRGDVDEMTDFARRELGAIGVLVNNAGIAQQKMFCDITEQDFDRMMGVTVKGAFNCTQAALPDMVHDKSGKIINVSSMWGVSGASCEVHYSAAKSALIGLTKALARELAPSNIQVNCIAPGVIDTDMNAPRHLSF